MKIDGACLCGQFKYEAEIDPAKVVVCHCTDCQIGSASAFRYGVLVPHDCFKRLSGELKTYVKTAESGHKRALAFCPDCGTQIYGTDPGAETSYSLRLGTARQRYDLEPKVQVWRRSAVGWLGRIDGLRAHATQPDKLRRA